MILTVIFMYKLGFLSFIFATFISGVSTAGEASFAPGSIQRSGMLACPLGSVMTGVDVSGSQILCLDGYQGLVLNERLDESPATQWPRTEGVPFLDNVVADAHSYVGPRMHTCLKDEVMTGLHLSRNAFLCSGMRQASSAHILGRYQVVQGERRNGFLACPRGMAMTGLHAGNATLFCAEINLCTQNDQCVPGNQCKSNDATARLNGLLCRPSGTVRLHKNDNCTGDVVRNVGAASGFRIPSLGRDGDDARSARFIGVKEGTIFEYFDDSRFSTGDDFARVTTNRNVNFGCVRNLDLPPNGRIGDVNFSGVKTMNGNLAGKVSSLRFFSQIKASDGRCLGRSRLGFADLSGERLVLDDCAGAGAVDWFRFSDGTIKIKGQRLDMCLSAYPFSILGESGETIERGEVFFRFCDRLGDDVRWTHTAAGQLKLYSNYCLTRQVGPFALTPKIELCQLPVPENQTWAANL